MIWDALGAAGEIVGALAVVVSVVYLAVQIGKQTAESRMAATRELSTLYHNALNPCPISAFPGFIIVISNLLTLINSSSVNLI